MSNVKLTIDREKFKKMIFEAAKNKLAEKIRARGITDFEIKDNGDGKLSITSSDPEVKKQIEEMLRK